MVISFQVSAPGKVILHGEHSVVYGKPAIAGVVQVRNKLELKVKNEGRVISVDFQKLGLTFELDIEALDVFINSIRDSYKQIQLPKDLDHDAFCALVDAFVSEQFQSKELSPRERNSIMSFVYLLVGIKIQAKADGKTPAFHVTLDTAMSIGAGLGSSASFGVCLAGAFVMLTGLQGDAEFIGNFNGSKNGVDKHAVLQEISDWAFCSEKIMHGNPSGLDNTICTFGNVVKFYRGKEPEPINLACSLPILLVDSNVSRSTATLVQKVVALRERHPKVVQSLFEAMGEVVEDASEILKTIKEGDEAKFQQLETLVAINNNLLRAIDVSHPQLELIFAAADRHGFKAKLSGAGGGGFAMILLGPAEQWTTRGYEALREELIGLKFELIETELGGAGFQVEEEAI